MEGRRFSESNFQNETGMQKMLGGKHQPPWGGEGCAAGIQFKGGGCTSLIAVESDPY